MATKPFPATIRGKRVTVHQNAYTGLFYAIRRDGRRTPVDYSLIRTQTTGIQRLKYWRNRHGYTQAELAKLIHVSSPTIIMMWENGLRHPRKEYRQRLNAELGGEVFFE
ncbi:MAG: helix-turn-helix protein [Namikivirus ohi]|uniref:Helix-turn-helix protein n=1 Tax=Bacteriophage sp. TaxID=38018 RepID=A0ABY5T6N5_9VIRU|nr:MAG: helix-turn-helix protein [Bacteriophage sp.]